MDAATSDYYDIVIIGNLRKGKSTLGKKLLHGSDNENVSADDQEMIVQKVGKWPTENVEFLDFRTSAQSWEVQLVNEKCELAVNEQTKLRVLDTPGLSPSRRDGSVLQANQQIARWIALRLQTMHVQRVVYFYPERGVPDKMDGNLQEELQVMYDFFGIDIFYYMVVVGTEDERYTMGLTEDDCKKIRGIFFEAAQKVTDGKLTTSPPVVYFGHKDDKNYVYKKILSANVLAKRGYFQPAFQKKTCSRCKSIVRYIQGTSLIPICVEDDSENPKEYEESKCCPDFIPKYSTIEKIVGGLAHIVTLGIPYTIAIITNKEIWPSFSNSDEMCPYHRRQQLEPGQGCFPVLKKVKINEVDAMIDHACA